MTDALRYPEDGWGFDELRDKVEGVIDTSRRLPAWPLRARSTACTDICQFGHSIEGPFGPVLQSLADFHGDGLVTTVVLEPTPAYYRENYGTYPAFSLARAALAASFWDCVSFEPRGDPTGAVVYTANVAATVGSS